MALVHDTAAAEAEPSEENWLFAAAADGPAETPPSNRGKLLIGLLLLLAMGIGAVALVLTLAPWANAVGGCGGG
ncbi:hypothetical protein OG607_37505 [Streptomyces sp. NBC_01537]|uniref:hypothetical protein n=1 Tax=Streptomyces sp. NBC_01537 TaxID=2903896 RepID=UPI0038692C36